MTETLHLVRDFLGKGIILYCNFGSFSKLSLKYKYFLMKMSVISFKFRMKIFSMYHYKTILLKHCMSLADGREYAVVKICTV